MNGAGRMRVSSLHHRTLIWDVHQKPANPRQHPHGGQTSARRIRLLSTEMLKGVSSMCCQAVTLLEVLLPQRLPILAFVA